MIFIRVFVSIILCVFPEYAQVTKMLGNGRLEAMCFDGTKRLCHIRGKLRKKVTHLMSQTNKIYYVNKCCK